ncbi:MAG: hypothetical protein ACREJ2_05475 [Planctomycetota bacterium]
MPDHRFPSEHPRSRRFGDRATGPDAPDFHVRFLTLSMCQGNMEQFVTAFNQFCRQEDVFVEEVRLHEEYEDTGDPFMGMGEEGDENKDKERPSYIDIVHDIVAEVWYRDTPPDVTAEQRQHARIFVSEGMRDELDFYDTINAFCARSAIVASVRAGSPFNRSLVCIYKGKDPEETEFKLVEESIADKSIEDETTATDDMEDSEPVKRRRPRRDRKKNRE